MNLKEIDREAEVWRDLVLEYFEWRSSMNRFYRCKISFTLTNDRDCDSF